MNRTISSIIKHSERKIKKEPTKVTLIPSGSTLLNLALSGRTSGGFATRKVANIIGDSHSGKTLLALTMLAEICTRPEFDKHKLIYDDAEAALEFDIEKLFGKMLYERLIVKKASNTVEEFQYKILTQLNKGKPIIYILDSLDAVDSEDDIKKTDEEMRAREKGLKAKGSYGMSKPKKMSEMFRKLVRKLKETNSFLVIISQTRDNINPMSFTPKTRSGGRALEFYSSFIIWLGVAKKHKKHDRMVGID